MTIITKSLPGADFLYLNTLISKEKNILWVADSNEDLKKLLKIASFFLARPVFLFPSSIEDEAIRARTLTLITEKQKNSYVVLTTKEAINIPLANSVYSSMQLNKIQLPQLIKFMENTGYHRVDTVRSVGEYAIHGGLVDLYSSEKLPIRLDFFGNILESCYFFDPSTQQRLYKLDKNLSIYPRVLQKNKNEKINLLHYTKSFFHAGKLGVIFTPFSHEGGITLPYKKHNFTINDLIDCLKLKKKLLFTLENKFFLKKLFEIIKPFPEVQSSKNLPKISYTFLNLEKGFEGKELLVLSQKDLFSDIKFLKKYNLQTKKTNLLLGESMTLMPNDLVVHIDYGIGKYLGLVKVSVNNKQYDCLLILYANNEKLYLPTTNSELISRFGNSDHSLNRLGDNGWKITKEKILKKIKETSDKIIHLAAERDQIKGEIFHKKEDYEQFISRFPYIETKGQMQAINDVMYDLTSGKVMDRLICGDVGFGKTEVALRASFLVAASGFQVIIITPTTILAHQHYKKFIKRFDGFGINIAMLSRYNTQKESKKIKENLKNGIIRIVIGSHALLSKNVFFHNPGLLIIDEEHHFGVMQKERLKSFNKNIHVLTLSATPIPRTLQFALSGLRDLSIIATPPIERIPIKTYIMPYNEKTIQESLIREWKRNGQSFFIVPHIKNIAEIKKILHKLTPELRLAVVHGELSTKEIDNTMKKFIQGMYDVLIATNIIESGINIKKVNTIIIYRAEQFGLAQAYQLRGRVGRSDIQAFCYMLYSINKSLSQNAIKRLEVLQTLDHLGAGFNIANYDMDIRGVGNLLGKEQSGHIQAIGIELYQKMLQDALLKIDHTNSLEEFWSPQVTINNSALIPEQYIPEIQSRVMFYKRLSESKSEKECQIIQEDMVDRFGKLPVEVKRLFYVIQLKILCRICNIAQLNIGNKGALITFKNNSFNAHDQLIELIKKENLHIRTDQKLFISFSLKEEKLNFQYIKNILNTLKSFLRNKENDNIKNASC